MSFSAGKRDADDAGGGGEDFLWLAAEDLCGGGARSASGIESGLARGAVGVAGVDGDDADFSASGAQVLLVDDKRRGGNAVCGEGSGGAGRSIGDDEGEISAAALLSGRLWLLRIGNREGVRSW